MTPALADTCYEVGTCNPRHLKAGKDGGTSNDIFVRSPLAAYFRLAGAGQSRNDCLVVGLHWNAPLGVDTDQAADLTIGRPITKLAKP